MAGKLAIAPDVLNIIGRATTDGNNFFLPPGALDRDTYTRVNKVLELVGGKWNRSAKAHVFAGPANDAVESILITGEVIDLKKALQAFYTPVDLANRIVQMAGVTAGMHVLEPSAGGGAIAKAVLATGATVGCIEINPAAVKGLANEGIEAIERDFLTVEPINVFDRVVMNPPFTGGQDVKHVTHALSFLKPGGRLVSIMSPTWRYRDQRWAGEFRDLLAAHNGTVTEVPAGAFKESGTMIQTVIVTMDKTQ